jgi:hypothetical protein
MLTLSRRASPGFLLPASNTALHVGTHSVTLPYHHDGVLTFARDPDFAKHAW